MPEINYENMYKGLLSPRERDIAIMIANEGISTAEIAERLHLSSKTIKIHLDRTFTKLGLNNRTQLAAWVWTWGVIDPPEAGLRRATPP